MNPKRQLIVQPKYPQKNPKYFWDDTLSVIVSFWVDKVTSSEKYEQVKIIHLGSCNVNPIRDSCAWTKVDCQYVIASLTDVVEMYWIVSSE